MEAGAPVRIAAELFGLGRPTDEPTLVRRGDTDVWRLDAAGRSYLVKVYRSTTDGQFVSGGLIDQLRVAMAFERRALDAGIDMPEPVAPLEPAEGWLARIDGRFVRVYRWIEHRKLRPEDDIAGWLGRTMARIHQLQPRNRTGLPDWWRGPVWPRGTWEEWFGQATRLGRGWARLGYACLPTILELTARIARLCESAADPVTTHGDIKHHNMLMAPNGPVLVDWDSVRTDSAALEVGRVAHAFGAGDHQPTDAILRAYVRAGGDLGWTGRDLYLSVLRHDLHGLFERILVSLGQASAAHWMGDEAAIEQSITRTLRDLPERCRGLDELANRTGGGPATRRGSADVP